jgi:hypothetical protein
MANDDANVGSRRARSTAHPGHDADHETRWMVTTADDIFYMAKEAGDAVNPGRNVIVASTAKRRCLGV